MGFFRFHANTINVYFYVLTLATKFLLLCFGTQLESPHSVVNNELFESLDDMEIKIRFLAIWQRASPLGIFLRHRISRWLFYCK